MYNEKFPDAPVETFRDAGNITAPLSPCTTMQLKDEIKYKISGDRRKHTHHNGEFLPRQNSGRQASDNTDPGMGGIYGKYAGKNQRRHSGIGNELQKFFHFRAELHLVDQNGRKCPGNVSYNGHS